MRSGSGAGASWAQQGEKLAGGGEESGKGEFGWSVALSGDGDTALVGGIGDSKWAGAAWVFGNEPPAPEPPPSGSPSGGNPTPGTQTQTAGGGSSGATGTPKQGVAAYQVAGGGVVLLAKRLPTAGGRVRVRLRCTATTTCRGRLTLTLAPQARAARRSRAVTLAKSAFLILHGRAVNRRAPARPRRPLACARRPWVSAREPCDPRSGAGSPEDACLRGQARAAARRSLTIL